MNPEKENDALGSPGQWIIHAEGDLRLGRLGADDPSVLPQQVCFHAQQAAEKALKGVLLSLGIEFPYTHDIKGLLKIAEASAVVIPTTIQQAALLTPYAVETRYSGDWMDITAPMCRKLCRLQNKPFHGPEAYWHQGETKHEYTYPSSLDRAGQAPS
jgi:HEPN domain-containing protein